MKKTAKIFAVILSICLLFSVIATNIFAAEVVAPDLQPSDSQIKSTVGIDFEKHSPSTSFGGNATTEKYGDIQYGWYSARSIHDLLVTQQTDPEGLYTNNYISFRRKDDKVGTSSAYWEFRIADTNNKTHVVGDYSFIVIDFDISSDEYVYELPNGETVHSATLPDGIEEGSYTLAYPELLNISPVVRDGGSTATLYTLSHNNKWYLSIDASYDPSDMPLSNVAGAWNHVTFVIVIDENQMINSMNYVYFNGEFMGEKPFATAVRSGLADTVRFTVPTTICTTPDLFYNFALDNLSCKYYDFGYDSGDTYGLDDYYTSINHKEVNLTACKDIVYNVDYPYFGSNTPYSYVIKHLGSENTIGEFSLTKTLAQLKNGDFITINKSINDFTPPLLEGDKPIDTLTFIAENGTAFTLSEEAKEVYKLQKTGNVYTIVYDPESAINLKWYNAEGEGREVVKEQMLFPLSFPNATIEQLQIHGKSDVATNKKNPTIEILRGWEWDLDNDGYSDGIEISALSAADVADLKERGFTTVSLVPKFEEKSLAYAVQYMGADNKMYFYAPDFDYERMTDKNNLAESLMTAVTSDEVLVTLFTDYSTEGRTYITKSLLIPSNSNVAIDLNGHTLMQSSTAATASSLLLFDICEGATLSVFSSKAGGAIIQANIESFGYGIFGSSDVDGCTVNLGARRDKNGLIKYSGNNLVCYGGALFNFVGKATDYPNLNKINVNIDGGQYFGTLASPYNALIPITDLDMTVNIANNATVGTTNGNAVFSSVNVNAHSANISINKSTIIASNVSYDLNANNIVESVEFVSFIKNWSNKCKIDITESKVLGFDSDKENVTLGKYNKFVVSADGNKFATVDNVAPAYSNNHLVTYNLSIAVPYAMKNIYKGIALSEQCLTPYALSGSYEVTLLTVPTNEELTPDFASVRKVSWYKSLAQGAAVPELYTENYWVAGSTVAPLDVNLGTHDLDNDWYDRIYDNWDNITDGAQTDDLIVSADKENKFISVIGSSIVALDAKLNIEFSADFKYNLYLSALPEGVVFDCLNASADTGFFDAQGNKILTGVTTNATLEGVSGYYKISDVIAIDAISSGDIVIKYTVDGVMLTKTIVVDLIDYAYEVDAEFGCGTDESQLVFSMLKYKLAAYKAYIEVNDLSEDPKFTLSFDDYFASHGTDCNCNAVDYVAPSETIDNSQISELVGFEFALVFDANTHKYSPAFIVTTEAAKGVTNVSAIIEDAKLENLDSDFVRVDLDGAIEYRWYNVSLAMVSRVIKITVTTDAGSFVGTYSLAEFIKTNDYDIAKALYVISDKAYVSELAKLDEN